MAYIYRYQLRNPALRSTTDLLPYSQKIESVLAEHFQKNLKDVHTESDYFEFKLYETVSKGLLQEMGRRLKSTFPFIAGGYGFIRMEQTLYALVHSAHDSIEENRDEEVIHIELIDSILVDKYDQYIKRANEFFSRTSRRELLRENGSGDNIDEIIRNYYIDILDVYTNINELPDLLKRVEKKSCFLIKGYHRHYTKKQFTNSEYTKNTLMLEKAFDAGYIESKTYLSKSEDDGEQKSFDSIKIYEAEEQSERIKQIEEQLALHLFSVKEVRALRNVESGTDYVFRVHNVGQALATSLSYEDNAPFVYFDYGMPYGQNAFTAPADINMITNPGTTIILSHVDQDHWFRITYDLNAYRCNWFVPDQPRKAKLNHKFAEIIVLGGTVQIINCDIVFIGGRITCGGTSTTDRDRMAHHVHETGLTLRLEACVKEYHEKEKDVNILVAGDQRYDYVGRTQLTDLDILVASHHGGIYFWSEVNRDVPIARSIDSSLVIYSYGAGNTHRHPSTTGDYTAANWRQEHHTSIEGDYNIRISFR